METISVKKTLSRTLSVGLLVTAFLTGGVNTTTMQAHGAESIVDRVQAVIKTRLDDGTAIKALACQGEMICGIQMLPLAYGKRDHLPLWIDASPEPGKS
jgi:hypothetical protein